jgi:hypothetical protein
MKTISDIYTEYKVLPFLQLHMLRVAAVAHIVCDSMEVPVNKEIIIATCLLHDMGNIIKMNMTYYPEAFEPEGVQYWQGVKDEYIRKYGGNETEGTRMIVKEIGREDLLPFIDTFGFPNWKKNLETGDLNKKICFYVDQRVSPKKIVSVQGRLEEGAKRYNKNYDVLELGHDNVLNSLIEIEKQIFEHSKIKPEDITDETVAPLISKLKEFVIK